MIERRDVEEIGDGDERADQNQGLETVEQSRMRGLARQHDEQGGDDQKGREGIDEGGARHRLSS